MVCYLVRHGKDDETVRGGWSTHSLTGEGIEQVNQLGKEIAEAKMDVACIYSSDIQRAKETAMILSGYLKCSVIEMPEFREANNGDLAGMKNEEADDKFPGIYWSALSYDECYPNGESPQEFFSRIKTGWEQFKEKILKKTPKDVLLVTHGGVVEAILCIENGIEFSNKEKHFRALNAKLIPIEIRK